MTIEWTITSSVLILAVTALRYAVKGKISLRLQYALWGLVLVRLLLPVNLFDSHVSVMHVAEELPAARVAAALGRVEIPSQSFQSAYEEVVEEYEARGVDVSTLTGSEREALDYQAYVKMEGPTVAEVAQGLWLTGVGVVLLTFLWANARFARRLKGSVPLEGTDCPLPVYVTNGVETPCLFGLLRPAVYVTWEVAEDKEMLEHVLAHEVTHHRHGDHIWAALRCLSTALHWYDPLVWMAAALSKRDSELACDEGAIARLGEEERLAYGRTLIGLTCQKRGGLLLTATTMTGSKKGIWERVGLIATKPKRAAHALAAALIIGVAASACTFTGSGTQSGAATFVPVVFQTPAVETPAVQTPAAENASGLPSSLYTLLEGEPAMEFTLYRWNGNSYDLHRPYTVEDSYHPARLKVLLDGFVWSPLEEGDTAYGGDRVAVSFPDGQSLTFHQDGEQETLEYNDGSAVTWWRASSNVNSSMTEAVRFLYDNLDMDYSRVSFYLEGTAEEAARLFAREVYATHWLNLAPGSSYGIADYALVDWGVRETTPDDRAVVGWFECAVIPDVDPGTNSLWAGNTVEGEGEYEGWLTMYREFALVRGEDGYWRCVEMGTGGLNLGYLEIENTDTQVAGGEDNSVLLRPDGSVWAWGDDTTTSE